MRRRLVFLELCSVLAWTAGTAHAQADAPRRPGLFREIRQRLIPPDAEEAWGEARSLPSALEALPLMENLARRDAEQSPAAALWLGHFYYGAGDAATALTWFAQAAREARESPLREEARFWESHCRNAASGDAEARPAPARAGGTVWERIARADALARAGNAAGARAACLDLEADARAGGEFSPILYRLMRLASEGEGARDADPGKRFAEWSTAAGPSPERALARGLFAALPRPAAAPEPSAEPALFAVPAESTEAALGVPAADTVLPAEPGGPPAESFEIQLGSYEEGERARLEAERLRGLGLPVRVEAAPSERGPLYKLRWGSFRSREEAEESARTRCTGLEWMVVRAGAPAP